VPHSVNFKPRPSGGRGFLLPNLTSRRSELLSAPSARYKHAGGLNLVAFPYSGAAANIPAINKMKPAANHRSSG
jgi:hypothetical protein